jgi:integrase
LITPTLPKPEMWLEDYLHEVYCNTHVLRPGTIYQYQIAINCLDEWSGEPLRVSELGDTLINCWLKHLETKGLAPATIRSRRTHILSLWYAAFKGGLCPSRPTDVRIAPVPYNPPRAWRWEEVQKLLDTTEKLKGSYPGERWVLPQEKRYRRARGCASVTASVYWGLFIRLAWDTAIRQGDLFKLQLSNFNKDGHGEIVQRKTRMWHFVRVHPETMQFILQSFPPSREFIMPTWHASIELWRREFRRIVGLAGLDGTAKKIRKSSATDVEIHFPGCGPAHLGHVSEMSLAQAHYLDPRLIRKNKPMPQPLRVQEGGAR